MNIFICVMVFIFGLIFGSFYNVVGYRVPKKESIVFPSSNCPNCKHKLKFYENIPLLSYMFLGGKCKCCKKRISIIYPFFEALTGVLFLICYLVFGLTPSFASSIIIVSVLIIITISDIRYYIIPDEVLIIGSILLIISYVVTCFINKTSFVDGVLFKILHGLGSFALLYLIKALCDFLFKKESLGGGDIKLLFFIGLSIGLDMSIVTIFMSSFIALPLSIYNLIKKDTNILPFGPYLAISTLIILFTKLDINTIYNFFIS